MKTLKFISEPTHIELWDAIVNQLLYTKNGEIPFFEGIRNVLDEHKVKTILDVCAGSGFPAIHLRSQGYDVDCMDASSEAITTFRNNAIKAGVRDDITSGNLGNIEQAFGNKTYDGIICKGTIWYANDGYHLGKRNIRTYEQSKEDSINAIQRAFRGFHKHLNQRGMLYVDKYKDSEKSHFDKVAEIIYPGSKEELFFDITYENGLRIGSTTRINQNGEEKKHSCYAHDLQSNELEKIITNTGFEFEKTNIKGEDFFDIWICKKL